MAPDIGWPTQARFFVAAFPIAEVRSGGHPVGDAYRSDCPGASGPGQAQHRTFCCTAPLPAHVVQRRGCPGHRGRLARSRAGSAVGQAAPATRSEIFCSSCLLGAGHPGRHAASPKHMREGRAWAGRRRCVSTASCLKKGREWPRTGTRGAEIAAGETLAVGSTQTSDDRPCCTVAVAAVSPSSRSSAFRLLLCFASVDRSVGGGGFRFGGPSRGVAALHQPPPVSWFHLPSVVSSHLILRRSHPSDAWLPSRSCAHSAPGHGCPRLRPRRIATCVSRPNPFDIACLAWEPAAVAAGTHPHPDKG